MFAQACEALVRERDRVFLERIAKDYNLDFDELSVKYLECSETAIKVPRKYTKKPKDVSVVTEKTAAPTKTKEPITKNCCTSQTSKKEPCKFSALKGEVFCLRHLKQSRGETNQPAPKNAKAKKEAKVEPIHIHPLDEDSTDCDTCSKYGKPLAPTPTEFETVNLSPAERMASAPVELTPVKLTAAQRLAAMLMEAESDSDSDQENFDTVVEEAYEDD